MYVYYTYYICIMLSICIYTLYFALYYVCIMQTILLYELLSPYELVSKTHYFENFIYKLSSKIMYFLDLFTFCLNLHAIKRSFIFAATGTAFIRRLSAAVSGRFSTRSNATRLHLDHVRSRSRCLGEGSVLPAVGDGRSVRWKDSPGHDPASRSSPDDHVQM